MAGMPSERVNVPGEVEAEIGTLISKLHVMGWSVIAAYYESKFFGDWYVDLVRGAVMMRLAKDRSQYMIQKPFLQVKDAGVWRAFDDVEEFQTAILNWAMGRDEMHLPVDFPAALCFHQHIRMQRIMTIPATDIRIIPVMIIASS